MKKRQKDLKEALNRPKKVNEILAEQIDTALKEHRRSKKELLISSFSAGLEIGFSVLLIAALFTLFSPILHASQLHIILALAYPLGFIFVVIGKSELFTEHTTLAVLPVLNRNEGVINLLVLWGIIYGGNIMGGFVFSFFLVWIPVHMDFINNQSLVYLAENLVRYPWYIILGSGIMAGWLMGLLSWLVTSSQETISRIFIIVLITFVIGIGPLHHSIVGSIELFSAAIISDHIGAGDYLKNQVWSTVGNIIGGVVFVALVKFSHVNATQKITKRDEER